MATPPAKNLGGSSESTLALEPTSSKVEGKKRAIDEDGEATATDEDGPILDKPP